MNLKICTIAVASLTTSPQQDSVANLAQLFLKYYLKIKRAFTRHMSGYGATKTQAERVLLTRVFLPSVHTISSVLKTYDMSKT